MTPEEIAEMDKISGIQTAPPNAVDSDARINELKALRESRPKSFMEKAGGFVGDVIKTPFRVAEEAKKSSMEKGAAIAEQLINKPHMTIPEQATGGAEISKQATGIAATPALQLWNESIGRVVNPLVEKAAGGIGDFIKGAAPEFSQSWDKVPEVWRKFVTDLLQTGANVSMVGGPMAIAKNPALVAKPIKKTAEITKDIVTKPIKSAKKLMNKSTAIKTHEEIAAVPENEVYKLNSVDRGIRKEIDNTRLKEKHSAETEELMTKIENERNLTEAEKVKQFESLAKKQEQEIAGSNQKFAELEQNARDVFEKRKSEAESEMANLEKEYEKGTLEKTIEIRPDIVEGLRKNSEVFETMTEEAFAKSPAGGNAAINTKAISNKIEKMFKNELNPEISIQQMKETLGIADGETITARELYNNIKAAKQEISSSSKAGNRVYSAEEYNLTKILSEAGDELKKVGVDMSEANAFWRKHAETRDNIVKKIKPFRANEYDAGTFADMIKRQAEGKVKALREENFVGDVEKLIGENVTNEAKVAYSKYADKKALVDNLNDEISKVGSMTNTEAKAELSRIKQKYEAMTEAQKANFDEISGMKKGQFEKELADLEKAQSIEASSLKTAQDITDQMARRLEIKKTLVKYAFWAFGMFSVGRGASMVL
jgi:hypothetical protein